MKKNIFYNLERPAELSWVIFWTGGPDSGKVGGINLDLYKLGAVYLFINNFSFLSFSVPRRWYFQIFIFLLHIQSLSSFVSVHVFSDIEVPSEALSER